MDLISSLFLGFFQGITEFLPISSSGHTELFLRLFNLKSSNVTFDVVIHLASLIALLMFFRFNFSNFSQEDFDIKSNKMWIALSFVPIGFFWINFLETLLMKNQESLYLLDLHLFFQD